MLAEPPMLADLNLSNNTLLTIALCLAILIGVLFLFGRGWRR